jgi:hypothetical protein
MVEIRRETPVRFDALPQKSEVRDNWTVILEYAEEGEGPWIADLAHKTRWDLQDSGMDEHVPCGLTMPVSFGQCTFDGQTLISRMNPTQASIYHLGLQVPFPPNFSGYTDVTESTLFLALFGPKTFQLAEKLTNLDLTEPDKKVPFLLQGPFCRLPCQIVVMEKERDGSGGFLLTCSRGYGKSMALAVAKAGNSLGLMPAGEFRFMEWIERLKK